MKNILVKLATVTKSYAAGTPDEPFLFQLIDVHSGAVVAEYNTTNPSVTFSGVWEGDYSVKVTKKDVSINAPITVPGDVGDLQVPATLTLTLG